MTDRKRRILSVLTALVPVLFFALLEIGLRVAGFGSSYPLFVPVAGRPDYLTPNEQVMRRYFANPDQAPAVSIDSSYFRSEKPADTLRIFVQGGSTAAGFPYGRWASPAGMLERRIMETLPGRDIEVVTTAMSAVNSYTLVDLSTEILAQSPDVVVVYAGHNEYLGVLGVGSTMAGNGSHTLKRLILLLRHWRTFQLVARVLARPGQSDASAPAAGTLMARIAGQRNIPLNSALYRAGLDQFERNLDRLLAKYQSAGIPVLIGTLASNERHQPPFAGGPGANTNTEKWRTAHETARLARLGPSADLDAATALLTLDTDAADAWFLYGQTLDRMNRTDEARKAFVEARDRDRLRFRAPSAMNEIIRRVSARRGALVVEVESALRDASPNRIVGNELMLEHLHPNVRGYFLLADAYYDSLLAAGVLGSAVAQPAEIAWQHRPLTEVEQLSGEYRVQRLLGDWPFSQQKREIQLPPPTTPIEQIARDWYEGRIDWLTAMNRTLVSYQQTDRYDEASRVALNIATAFPFEANPRFVAGQMLVREGRKSEALRYFHAAASMSPRNVDYLLALSQAFYVNGQFSNARTTIDRVLAADPSNDRALQMRIQLERDSTG